MAAPGMAGTAQAHRHDRRPGRRLVPRGHRLADGQHRDHGPRLWGQALDLIERPGYFEKNPLLGEHPSRAAVNMYFASIAVYWTGRWTSSRFNWMDDAVPPRMAVYFIQTPIKITVGLSILWICRHPHAPILRLAMRRLCAAQLPLRAHKHIGP